MNNQPVLFASTRCPNSAKILETLKALNKDTLCRILYIDNYQRSQLPSFLKSVPTLYIPDSKEVYVLDVMTPYTEHVLPMIPSGKTYKDIITE